MLAPFQILYVSLLGFGGLGLGGMKVYGFMCVYRGDDFSLWAFGTPGLWTMDFGPWVFWGNHPTYFEDQRGRKAKL